MKATKGEGKRPIQGTWGYTGNEEGKERGKEGQERVEEGALEKARPN